MIRFQSRKCYLTCQVRDVIDGKPGFGGEALVDEGEEDT
jgi:hypothetical protein